MNVRGLSFVLCLCGFVFTDHVIGAITAPTPNQVFATGTTSIDFGWSLLDEVNSWDLKVLYNGADFFSTEGILGTSLRLDHAYKPGYYTVLVRGEGYIGKGPWSAPVTFIVKRAMTPSGNPILSLAPGVFNWTRSYDATQYLLKLSRLDPSTGTFVVKYTAWLSQPASGLPKWSPPAGLMPAGSYRWTLTDYFNGKAGYTSSALFQVRPPSRMSLIPAGLFNMGDALGDNGLWETPVHTVYVSAFNMDKYEVTKTLWDNVYLWAIMRSGAKRYTFSTAGSAKGASHPVQQINEYDMLKWCNARSEKEGRPPVYYTDEGLSQVYRTGDVTPFVNWNAIGYRLPTEAEWEKAARGGLGGKRFPWGNTIQYSRANYNREYRPPSYDIGTTWGDHPTFNHGGTPHTSPVGYFAPNAYGLYDMAGNVWEVCWDFLADSYDNSSVMVNPRGPAQEYFHNGHVKRGGAWNMWSICRVAGRGSFPEFDGYYWDSVGFRTVLITGG